MKYPAIISIAISVGISCADARHRTLESIDKEREDVGLMSEGRVLAEASITPSRAGPSYNGLFHAYVGIDGIQYFTFGSRYSSGRPTCLAIYNDVPRSFFEMMSYDMDEAFEFDAGFEITAVHPRSKDDYYIAGKLGTEDVIEHWKRAPTTRVSGEAGYAMKRRRLFSGDLGGVMALGIHHRARYLLILHGSVPTSLSRMPLPDARQLVEVLSSHNVPSLGAVRFGLFERRHSSEGIVWTLEDRDSFWDRHYIVLRDLEDDGVIDSWDAYLEPEYASLYRGSPDPWVDNFIGD